MHDCHVHFSRDFTWLGVVKEGRKNRHTDPYKENLESVDIVPCDGLTAVISTTRNLGAYPMPCIGEGATLSLQGLHRDKQSQAVNFREEEAVIC